MSHNYALTLWTKTKQTSVVPEEAFVKTFGENGKENPLCERAVRTVSIADKPYEGKILRISASKKFLESLLVTKDGKVLMHGTKPSTCDILAKRSRLFNDETEEQRKERQVFRNLSLKTEEQQPNIRLKSFSGCSHGCPSCCSGTLPPFPTIPEGFISTVVSLAQYFHQFHKSTIANIIAAGHNIDKGEPEPWRTKAEGKMEVIVGSGVWINTKVFERIVLQVDSSKKPPQQTLVKTLLTHLLGVEKYIETPAERMDRRLVSAVVEFVNERYCETTQPPDRFNRCINLNRAYMLKRKNEGHLDDSYLTAKYFDKFDSTRDEKNKSYSELEAKRARKTASSISTIPSTDTNPNIFGSGNQMMIPFHNENFEDMQVSPNSNTNKIIVVRRPVTTLSSFENIQQGPVVVSSNYQSSVTSVNTLPIVANRSLNQSANRSILVSSNQASTLSSNLVAVTSDRPIGAMSQLRSVNSSVLPLGTVRSVPDRTVGAVSQMLPVNSSVLPVGTVRSVPAAVSQMHPVNSTVLPVGSVRSVPSQIQPNLLLNSMTPVKSVSVAPSTPSRAFNTMNRPVFTTTQQPTVNRVVTSQQISTSKGLLTFTPTQRYSSPPAARVVVASNSVSNSQPRTPLSSNKIKVLPASSAASGPSSQLTNRLPSQPVRGSGPHQSKTSRVPSPDIIEIMDDSEVSAPSKSNVKSEESFEIEGALDFEL